MKTKLFEAPKGARESTQQISREREAFEASFNENITPCKERTRQYYVASNQDPAPWPFVIAVASPALLLLWGGFGEVLMYLWSAFFGVVWKNLLHKAAIPTVSFLYLVALIATGGNTVYMGLPFVAGVFAQSAVQNQKKLKNFKGVLLAYSVVLVLIAGFGGFSEKVIKSIDTVYEVEESVAVRIYTGGTQGSSYTTEVKFSGPGELKIIRYQRSDFIKYSTFAFFRDGEYAKPDSVYKIAKGWDARAYVGVVVDGEFIPRFVPGITYQDPTNFRGLLDSKR